VIRPSAIAEGVIGVPGGSNLPRADFLNPAPQKFPSKSVLQSQIHSCPAWVYKSKSNS
jgi:hypothetical protein